MPRRLLKRYMPDPHRLKGRKSLRPLARLLEDPFLLHLNRRSVAGGVGVGLFCALLPIPGQMFVAGLLAIGLRVNLVLSVGLIWITNPLTIPPIFYFNYTLGTWILGQPSPGPSFQPTLEWFWQQFESIWQPLLLGSVLMATLVGFAGYGLTHLLWRLYVLRHLRHRSQRPGRRLRRRPAPERGSADASR